MRGALGASGEVVRGAEGAVTGAVEGVERDAVGVAGGLPTWGDAARGVTRRVGLSPTATSASVATPIARSMTKGKTNASGAGMCAMTARSRSATNDRRNAPSARAAVATTAARYTRPEALVFASTAMPCTLANSTVGGTAATEAASHRVPVVAVSQAWTTFPMSETTVAPANQVQKNLVARR